MSWSSGTEGTTTTTGGVTRGIAAPSPTEAQLNETNMMVAREQADQLMRAIQTMNQYRQSPYFNMIPDIGGAAQGGLLASLMGGGLHPAAKAQIDQMYAPLQQQGEERLRRMADEMQGRAGVHTRQSSALSDAYLQNVGRFQQGMAGQKAGAYLGQSNQMNQFGQNMANFAHNVPLNAMRNRAMLAGTVPGSYGLSSGLFSQRLQSAPQQTYQSGGTTGSPSYGVTGQNIFQGASALGGLIPSISSWFGSPATSNYGSAGSFGDGSWDVGSGGWW